MVLNIKFRGGSQSSRAARGGERARARGGGGRVSIPRRLQSASVERRAAPSRRRAGVAPPAGPRLPALAASNLSPTVDAGKLDRPPFASSRRSRVRFPPRICARSSRDSNLPELSRTLQLNCFDFRDYFSWHRPLRSCDASGAGQVEARG